MLKGVLVLAMMVGVVSHAEAQELSKIDTFGKAVLVFDVRPAATLTDRRPDATVLATSALGGIVGGGLGYLAAGERLNGYHTAGVVVGAAIGAMAGARLESANTGVLGTVSGAAIGGLVPLAITLARDGEFSFAYAAALTLPVLGAWIGNRQSR